MRRRPLCLALACALALGACASEAVTVSLRPEPGDEHRFQHEIRGTITTTADDGSPPEVTELVATLEATQLVRAVRGDEIVLEVAVRRDGGAERTTVVAVDRAGTLVGFESLEGLPVDALGVAAVATERATSAAAPPDRGLVVGERWDVDDGVVRGEARLASLGVVDGVEVGRIDARLEERLAETQASGDSTVRLDGALRSRVSTTLDLRDGAIRRARSTTTGSVRAVIQPPGGIEAAPVTALIRYDLTVVTTRTDR
jgi:hypothetical protein